MSDEVSVLYETILDESAGEGYHRSTHLTRMRARASKTPFTKASVRANQTIGNLKLSLGKGDVGKRVLRYK